LFGLQKLYLYLYKFLLRGVYGVNLTRIPNPLWSFIRACLCARTIPPMKRLPLRNRRYAGVKRAPDESGRFKTRKLVGQASANRPFRTRHAGRNASRYARTTRFRSERIGGNWGQSKFVIPVATRPCGREGRRASPHRRPQGRG
jgi:hypothetical protein